MTTTTRTDLAHTHTRSIYLALGAAILLSPTATAWANPIVDGRFDPTEGYATGYLIDYGIEKSDQIATDGQLWTYQSPEVNGVYGDVYAYISLPRMFVDNTYGANSIGWGDDAPSGKDHKFKDLVGSDKIQLVFRNGVGAEVLDIKLDYITETSKGSGLYDCLGVTGGDGKVAAGYSADSVIAATSSMAYNINTLGHYLTVDSPQTDADYTPNIDYPDWLYDVSYELQVGGDVFGQSGLGDIYVTIHASPNKLAKNHTGTPIDIETAIIPEPVTLALIVVGGLGLSVRRRRR